jgi:hypothetical protein
VALGRFGKKAVGDMGTDGRAQWMHRAQELDHLLHWTESTHAFEGSQGDGHFRLVVRVRIVDGVNGVEMGGELPIWMGLVGAR